VLDNRTGKLYTVPIEQETVNALHFKQIKTPGDDEGLRCDRRGALNGSVYDPAYQNTAVAKSAITFIDGDAGILRYVLFPFDFLSILFYFSLSDANASRRYDFMDILLCFE
jgi:citrate synthase